MANAEETLNDYYKRRVRIDETAMQNNVKTAKNVAKCINRHYIKLTGDDSTVQSQGSAFEKVKTVSPDEFDFVLVQDHTNKGGLIKPEKIPGTSNMYTLPVDGKRLEKRDWVQKHTTQDSAGNRSLDATVSKKQVQKVMNDFTQKFNARDKTAVGGKTAGYFSCFSDVSSISHASIGDPAATIEVTTKGGNAISMDVTPAVKLKDGDGDALYIAKRHGDQLAWKKTESREDMKEMLKLPEKVRENYRTAKTLLKPVVEDSFIEKTAFLTLKDEDPKAVETKSGTLKGMIDVLAKSYQTGSLPAYNNPEENVIDKVAGKPTYRQGKANELRHLKNRAEKDFDGVIQDLRRRADP